MTALLIGCSEAPSIARNTTLKSGVWRMNMFISNGVIPLRLEVDSVIGITLLNGDERITITDIFQAGDSLCLTMPRYESRFVGTILSDSKVTGSWYDLAKEDYSIPFEANYLGASNIKGEWVVGSKKKYDVTFNPGTEHAYPAIGVFETRAEDLRGTFLTETGDYRFLEGTLVENHFTLSNFDGAHMFLFKGEVRGDSIVNGTFSSGKHYTGLWSAAMNPNATLTHPDSLTYLLHENEAISVNVVDLEGKAVTINQDDYKGCVSIIQLFGTWCPNCYDENVFYKRLYEDYSAKGFQIIPIAFEASDDFDKSSAAVKAQFAEIGIPYACYLGPKRNKKVTSKMFPMLNEVISYPTSIFIDKSGKVRKIHTGFYGPGTGGYYEDFMMETTSFIECLLVE